MRIENKLIRNMNSARAFMSIVFLHFLSDPDVSND